VTPRPITTSHASVVCAVCGRTLLRGERADVFLTGGSRRTVCELCVARAAHEGWIREGVDDSLGVRPRADRGISLLGRLRQRRDEVAREPRSAEPVLGADIAPDGDAMPAAGRVNGRAAPVRAPAADPMREPRQVHAVPTNADLKTARALDVFNASQYPRTVAGVSRSLGLPFVVVRPSTSSGSLVSIVVGWELCWYRYEVDLADEASGVRLSAQGDELADLDTEDQLPNAAADDLGMLVLAGP
jgi:hypothetical protein